MSNFPSTSMRYLLTAILSTLLLAACAATPKTTPEAAPAPEAEKPEIPVEPWEGDPMDMPLDGSSMDSFDYSLARFKAHADEAEYQGLLNALDYLLIYDLGAKGDMELLASRLDGKTPREVLKRVKWRRPAPGKSEAEKGAADAKVIDS